MNRGSDRVRIQSERQPYGFNEAPIHESGKCDIRRPAELQHARRFNEAPIHESGKCRYAGDVEPGGGASMRPRFMNRGSVETKQFLEFSKGWLQ